MTSAHRNTRRHRPRVTTAILLLIASATTTLAPVWPAAAAETGPRVNQTRPNPVAAGADLVTPSGRVIRDLTAGRTAQALDELPTGFVADFGYRPTVVDGHPVDPDGSCSSPIPLPRRFDNACRTHDFGYDVLRFAAHTGHPLGRWARLDLDRMLVDRMRESCSSPMCLVAVGLVRTGLGLNTWRQYDGPPTAVESAGQIVSSGIGRGWAELVDRRSGTR